MYHFGKPPINKTTKRLSVEENYTALVRTGAIRPLPIVRNTDPVQDIEPGPVAIPEISNLLNAGPAAETAPDTTIVANDIALTEITGLDTIPAEIIRPTGILCRECIYPIIAAAKPVAQRKPRKEKKANRTIPVIVKQVSDPVNATVTIEKPSTENPVDIPLNAVPITRVVTTRKFSSRCRGGPFRDI
jgi:hypothetical protein